MPSFSDLDNDSSFQQAIAGLSPVNGTGASTVGAPQGMSGGVAGSIPYGGAPQGYGGSGNTGVAGQAGPTGSAPASGGWNPGMGRITPEQVSQQYGADPSVASYWADKINTGGDPNYYIGRLQQDNAGSGPDAKGGLSGGGSAGGGAPLPDGAMSGMSGIAGGGVPMQTGPGSIPSGGGRPSGWNGQAFNYNGPALQPFQPFQQPSDYQPENISGPNALVAEKYQLPDAYKATTAADLQADPSYQFRLSQGLNAVQASAAAKGLLRSGGTIKGLNDYAQNTASTEYANVDARRFGQYQANVQNTMGANAQNNSAAAQAYGLTNQYTQAAQQFNAARKDTAAQQNFTNRFNVANANTQNAAAIQGQAFNQGLQGWQANTNAQLSQGQLDLGYTNSQNQYSLGMAQNALGYYNANQGYDLGLRNNALGYYSASNGYNLGMANVGLGYANYGLGAQAQQFYQDTAFPVNTGLAATQAAGGAGQNYANQAGNYTTQAGNAGASGVVGSSNATNNGLAGAYNAGVNAYGLYQYGQRNPNQGITSGML